MTETHGERIADLLRRAGVMLSVGQAAMEQDDQARARDALAMAERLVGMARFEAGQATLWVGA